MTAIHLAVNEEWTEGVEVLLSYGASANILPLSVKDSNWPYQEIPVLTAARNGDYATALLLLEQDPNLRLTDPERNNILHLACSSHCVELVSYLLKDKLILSEISISNSKGNTPLHSLMIGENVLVFEEEIVEILEMLLQNGANINAKNAPNKTPLYLAARFSLSSVVKILLESGADPTILSRDGRSVLHAACHSGNHESLSLLLQHQKMKNLMLIEDHNGFAPFHIAVSSCSLNCCEILLQNGDHLTRQDSKNRSRCSLILNNIPSADLLLRRIFDSNIKISEEDPESADFNVKMNFSVLLSKSSQDVEASIISDISDSTSELLLKHPLIESFLYRKWNKIRWFFYIYVFLFFIFLIVHTYYVVMTFGMKSTWEDKNALMVVHILHVVLLLLLLIPGAITIFANVKKYFQQWETYFKVIALTTAAFVVFSTDTQNRTTGIQSESYNRSREIGTNVASVSIFFTWVEFMMLLGRFPALGIYILMFTRVAKSIIMFLLAFSSILIAFTLSFGILLVNIEVFNTFPTAFVKTLMMMIGEIDYSDIFEGTKNNSTANIVISHIFLVAFLFLIPILMANLLIGLAVNDLPDLQYHGKIRRLLKEASYLEAYERLLFVFKEWTCIPNSIINLFSNRSAIQREITVYPNKRTRYRMKSFNVPSEAVKVAIELGLKQKKEAEDMETIFKKFVKEYSNDRERLEKAFEILYEAVTSEEQEEDKVDGRYRSKRKLKALIRSSR